ncbi:MAG: hypothetical protein JWQ38_3535 [Flavipsychrobacter sp.]|nr:hypothetical protein [Flavipsychrobacter sp.]
MPDTELPKKEDSKKEEDKAETPGPPILGNSGAYAQGTDIHIAPGQETHLPHEGWHVKQD